MVHKIQRMDIVYNSAFLWAKSGLTVLKVIYVGLPGNLFTEMEKILYCIIYLREFHEYVFIVV